MVIDFQGASADTSVDKSSSSVLAVQNDVRSKEPPYSASGPHPVSASATASGSSTKQSSLLYSPTVDTPNTSSVPHSSMPPPRFVATFNPTVPPPSFSILTSLVSRPAPLGGVASLPGTGKVGAERRPSDEREKSKISDDMDIDDSSGDETPSCSLEANQADASSSSQNLGVCASSITSVSTSTEDVAKLDQNNRPKISQGYENLHLSVATSIVTASAIDSQSLLQHSLGAAPVSSSGDGSGFPLPHFPDNNMLMTNLPPGGLGPLMLRPDGMPNVSLASTPPGVLPPRFQLNVSGVHMTRFMGPMEPPPAGWFQPPVDVTVRPPLLVPAPRGVAPPTSGDGLVRGPMEVNTERGGIARVHIDVPPPGVGTVVRDLLPPMRMPGFSGVGDTSTSIRPPGEFMPVGGNAGMGLIRGPSDVKAGLTGLGPDAAKNFPAVSDHSVAGGFPSGMSGVQDGANLASLGNNSVRPFQEPVRGPGAEMNNTGFGYKPPGSADEIRFSSGGNAIGFGNVGRGPCDPPVSGLSGVPSIALVSPSGAPGLMMRGPMPANEGQNRFPPPSGPTGPAVMQFRGPACLNDSAGRFPGMPFGVQGSANEMHRGPVPVGEQPGRYPDPGRFPVPVGIRPGGPGDMPRAPLPLGEGSRMSGPPSGCLEHQVIILEDRCLSVTLLEE
jgi:hypothetical protein